MMATTTSRNLTPWYYSAKAMTTGSFALFGAAYVCAILGVPQLLFPLPALDIFRLHAHLPFMPAAYALGILPAIHGALLMMIIGQWFSKRGVRTLINETMRRTGIRLSLCFLANIAWYGLWCRDWQLWCSVSRFVHAIILSTCLADLHGLIATVLPATRARGVERFGRLWWERVKRETTKWDIALLKAPLSMYTCYSWWVAFLTAAIFVEARFPMLAGMMQHPAGSTALMFLALGQTWTTIQSGDIWSAMVSVWMLCGILVRGASQKSLPVVVSSAVGLNFVVILGLMMLALGLGAHRLPYVRGLFGYHKERAKTKSKEMYNAAQQKLQEGMQQAQAVGASRTD